MSAPDPDERFSPYRLEELEVRLEISEGKFAATSRSGPKGGSLELVDEPPSTRLTLKGTGSDEASVSLSAPELSNFRTIIDASLSSIIEDEESSDLERSSLFSGYRSLQAVGDEYGVSFDKKTLDQLGLLDESGGVPGGSRQVQCTVLPNGTAIINLRGDGESGFRF